MVSKRIFMIGLATLFMCASVGQTLGEEGASTAAVDAGAQKRIDGKVNKLLRSIPIDDEAKAGRVKAILGDWLVVMWKWHDEHRAELGDLWKQWSQARAAVPKDEFPGEVVAAKIQEVYASLKPAYEAFINKLGTELTPEQIDAFKEAWSRSPGMKRTYDAYLEIVPDLTDADKKVIHDRMLLAREEAMLTDSDKEIVNLYKTQKVKVEEYVGALEWGKLHKAFANRGKTEAAAAAGASTQPR
jgi:hypothetical protein